MSALMKVLVDVERLKVLRDLALIDSPAETLYDQLVRLASDVIGAPVALMSMVAADYQFFKSFVGLPEPWASARQTPLSHSFCQHVVATNEPLIVSDAREVDFLRDNLAIPDLDVIAYMGMPLTLHDGKALGSFCAIDSVPRTWSDVEIDILRELAYITTREIDLRALANADPVMKPRYEAAQRSIRQVIEGVDRNASKAEFLQQLRTAREQYEVSNPLPQRG